MSPNTTIIESCTTSGVAIEFECPGAVRWRPGSCGPVGEVWMPCRIDGFSAQISAPSRPALREKLVRVYLLTTEQALEVCPL